MAATKRKREISTKTAYSSGGVYMEVGETMDASSLTLEQIEEEKLASVTRNLAAINNFIADQNEKQNDTEQEEKKDEGK